MPYIKPEIRTQLDTLGVPPMVAGELNYKITQLLVKYVKTRELSYQAINDVLGALEGAKLEFYRRVVASYEDGKKDLNGDVY